MRTRKLWMIFLLAVIVLLTMISGGVSAQTTERVSVDSGGAEADGNSYAPSTSSDGRYVAFSSSAANLVTADDNTVSDIFVHDRKTGETTRVSVDSGGAQATGGSYYASISSDGRYVAFYSVAANLVTGDDNGVGDIFVHDRETGETTRVSVDSSGVQATGGSSLSPSISSDGRYVAFFSGATNLVADDTNAQSDVFVHDRDTGVTTRVSVDSSGVPATGGNSSAPSISSDGRYVAFYSLAANLVTGDTNATNDIFVHDRVTEETTRVSVDSGGGQATGNSYYPSISSGGRYVAFDSSAVDLVPDDTNDRGDIFVHDRQTGETTRVSVDSGGVQATDSSDFPSISSNGRYVAFESPAVDLVPNDTNAQSDIFVHDRRTGGTARVSVDSDGAQTFGESYAPSISSDGRYVAFHSGATDLVTGDTNAADDVFVHDYLGSPPSSSGGSSSSGGCFIATVAFGSYMKPHVKILKDLTDACLLPNRVGAAFVRLYYKIKAKFVSKHEFFCRTASN